MLRKLRAAVLGATGTVGQRFIQLLEDHPWFELGAVAASDRSVGKPFHRACSWKVPEPMPEYARDRILSPCRPGLEVDFVFSGLPSSIAGEVESDFARAGYPVVSNSRNHRMEADVPLLVPEINPDHLDLVPLQQERTRSSGFIVTNPNCTTIALVSGAGAAAPGLWPEKRQRSDHAGTFGRRLSRCSQPGRRRQRAALH